MFLHFAYLQPFAEGFLSDVGFNTVLPLSMSSSSITLANTLNLLCGSLGKRLGCAWERLFSFYQTFHFTLYHLLQHGYQDVSMKLFPPSTPVLPRSLKDICLPWCCSFPYCMFLDSRSPDWQLAFLYWSAWLSRDQVEPLVVFSWIHHSFVSYSVNHSGFVGRGIFWQVQELDVPAADDLLL